jgi:hypothetical protein
MHNRVSAHKMISRKLRAERGDRPAVAVSLDGKRFERFIEELSASFVRSSVDEIGGEIDRWIRRSKHDSVEFCLTDMLPENQTLVR